MCKKDEPKKQCCQKPEQAKGKAEDCCAEQVEKCHGDVPKHPCTSGPSCKKTKTN